MKKLYMAASAALMLFVGSASAASSDAVIKAQLESKGIKFEIDGDGDFKIVYKVGTKGRTQLVFVRSSVNTYGTLKVREIWSPGYKSETTDFPPLIANTLLRENHSVKLGAWEANENIAMFVVKIAADANAEQLVDAIEAAVNSADKLEESMSGSKDQY
ncbi:hypothetical protein [Arenimonas oryziterrae]|uniref:Uncharacterized protein n=1 Tax=Arenimonas oryziterrae DSM 21050 = YC6267 TaxID=1121015 RepID=A0A091AW40_9GAMM|nr:hypothetical protein [Arenimonas oryziterrae]KFN44498.1 hypothetical protein N789_00395 [Arenimonas oryziterrae DSM 21050 = YC6267]